MGVLDAYIVDDKTEERKALLGKYGFGSQKETQPGGFELRKAKLQRVEELKAYTESLPKPTSVLGDIGRTALSIPRDVAAHAGTIAKGIAAFGLRHSGFDQWHTHNIRT